MHCRRTLTAFWRETSRVSPVGLDISTNRITCTAKYLRQCPLPVWAIQLRWLHNTCPGLAAHQGFADVTTSASVERPKKKKHSVSPEDALIRRVNTLVGERNAAAAVQAVKAALHGSWEPRKVDMERAGGVSSEIGSSDVMPTSRFVFSTKAFAAALFACEATGDASSGLALVDEVRRCSSRGISTEWLQTEHVLSVILRLQCMVGDRDGATRMFAYLEQHGLLRLRSVSAFLQYCCSSLTDRRLAFAIYEAALKHKIELTERDYCALGRLCVQVREPVGTLFFMLQEMREHVSEVSEEMVRDVLEPWVSMANNDTAVGLKLRGAPMSLHLYRVDEMQHVPVASPALSTSAFASGAASTGDSAMAAPPADTQLCGVCPVCQAELAGYPFTAACRSHLLRELNELIIPKACRSRRALLGFEHWKRYIHARLDAGDRVDIFIDGANLGYYGLSSWYDLAKKQLMLHRGVPESRITGKDLDFNAQCKTSGRGVDVGVNFELIDASVKLAVDTYGMRSPLVMLHERHIEPKFMTSQSTAIVQYWKDRGWLYCSPTGLNDDLCWLYGALLLTDPTDTTPTSMTATAASPHRTFVCTNDKMRDHHFRLLSPRAFARWRDRHRIAFRCSRVGDRTELHWELPDSYERCIQQHDTRSELSLGQLDRQPTSSHHMSSHATLHTGSTHASGAAMVTSWHIPFTSAPQSAEVSTVLHASPDHESAHHSSGGEQAAVMPNKVDESAAQYHSTPLEEVGRDQDETTGEEGHDMTTGFAQTGPWVCISVHEEAVG